MYHITPVGARGTCRVAECRFPYSHTTAGHVCGSCGESGHGARECMWGRAAINRLGIDARNDIMLRPFWCNVPGCHMPHTHTRSAHHCGACNRRVPHTAATCPDAEYSDPPEALYGPISEYGRVPTPEPAPSCSVTDTTQRFAFPSPLAAGACPSCRSGVTAVGPGARPVAACAVCCDDTELCTLEPCRCSTACRACLVQHWRARGMVDGQ